MDNRLGEHTSCVKLWMSVLINGVDFAMRPITEKMLKSKSLQSRITEIEEARSWVMSDAQIFNSFLSLCGLSGVRPANFRKKLLLLIKLENELLGGKQ